MLGTEVKEKCNKAVVEVQALALDIIMLSVDVIRASAVFYVNGNYRALESIVADLQDPKSKIENIINDIRKG